MITINRQQVPAAVALLLYAAAAAVALALLHAAWCAFTSCKFNMVDYGLYAGATWNTAHGEPFRIFDGRENYLGRHLSFSLAVLAPLYWLTDHPFILSLAQWALAVAGTILLAALARRQGASAPQAAALALFYLLNPFTQSVLLSEFHGVALLLFALPWLAFTAVACPRWIWIPLVFLCGLREEAGLFSAPVLFVLARRQRSRLLLAAGLAALLYVALAIGVLYPAINGAPLHEKRTNLQANLHLFEHLSGAPLAARGQALGAVVFLLLPLLAAAPGTSLALLAVPLLVSLGSIVIPQYSLKLQYSAPVIAAMGVLGALALGRTSGFLSGRRGRLLLAAWLVAAAFLLHLARGFFWPAGGVNAAYRQAGDTGLRAVRAAAGIPKPGLLVCDDSLAAFCAHRRSLLPAGRYRIEADPPPEFIFGRMHRAVTLRPAVLDALLGRSAYGVRYFDGEVYVLEKGFKGSVAIDAIRRQR